MSKNWSFESLITTIACVKAYKNEKIKDAKESLKLGAEPNQVICSIIDWLIENPLITGDQEKFLKLLITKIDIEKIYKNNPIGWYLLNWATSTSAYKIIESILTLNSDTNKLNFGDYNLMCIPIRNGDVELMKLLFKYKINPNSPSYDGSLAISSAISVGRINMLKLLLENGAKTDIKDNWGNTPLDYAMLKGSIEIFRILANDKYNTNLDFKNQDGFSLLHMAFLKSYQSQLIQYLPNNYWDLKNLIKELKILETPLESWCIFDFLYKNCKNLESQDMFGNTIFHYIFMMPDIDEDLNKLILNPQALKICNTITNKEGQTAIVLMEEALSIIQNTIPQIIHLQLFPPPIEESSEAPLLGNSIYYSTESISE